MRPVRRWIFPTALMAMALVTVSMLSGFGEDARASDGSGRLPGRIVAYDAETGEQRWVRAPATGQWFWGVASDRRRVVATEAECSDSGGARRLSSFDARSGELLWSVRSPTGALDRSSEGDDPTARVPVGASGVVVTYGAGDGGGVFGLDARTGRRVWGQRGLLPTAVSRTLVFARPYPDLTTTALRRDDGSVVWSFGPDDGVRYVVFGADDRYVVMGSTAPWVDAPTTFVVLDGESGAERTRVTVEGVSERTVQVGDGRFVYASWNTIVARDLTTGDIAWEYSFGDEPATSTGVFVAAGRTWVSGTTDPSTVLASRYQDGRPVTAALDMATGSPRWTFPAWPVGADGRSVMFSSGILPNVTITMVDAALGTERWRVDRSEARAPYSDARTPVQGPTAVVAAVCTTE